jgi:hypothetical protein
MDESKDSLIISDSAYIQRRIYTLHNVQVMLDSDLAGFYGVETKRLNEQVKRNIERFPKEFMFQLRKDEYENLMSQIATSSSIHGGRRKSPYVFTEQGVAMLKFSKELIQLKENSLNMKWKLLKSLIRFLKHCKEMI